MNSVTIFENSTKLATPKALKESLVLIFLLNPVCSCVDPCEFFSFLWVNVLVGAFRGLTLLAVIGSVAICRWQIVLGLSLTI